MSLKCGIVGLPNVGKSTLFNALTKAGIAAENYPFCTIEPNVGIVEVPDPRLDALSEIVKPQRVQPAIVEFVDIAGLVAGASKGAIINAAYASNAAMVSAVNGAAATGFFNDATSTARGVKVVADGTDTFVFVDTNHDGNFAASSDLVIKLAGVVAPVIGDFTF